MSRMTLRLPESLHRQLTEQARQEGVSLNQYLVYSLTRLVSVRDLRNQMATFDGLTSRFSRDESEAALQALLANREPISS